MEVSKKTINDYTIELEINLGWKDLESPGKRAPLAVRPRRFWLVRCRTGRPCPATCLQEAGQRRVSTTPE